MNDKPKFDPSPVAMPAPEVIEEARRIRLRMEACETRDQLDIVCAEERANLAQNIEAKPNGRPLGIHIRNLKGALYRGRFHG